MDKAAVLKQARHEAFLYYSGLDNLKAHLDFVEALIDAPQLKPFIYVDDGEVLTELEVVNSLGHTKRLDRLIIKTKEIWIVDYKSGPDTDGNYQQQVREYVSVLKELHPKHLVRGFLIYMDKIGVEEIK